MQNKHSMNKFLTAAIIALFFAATLFIFAPSQVFLTNTREFAVLYSELIGRLALIALPFFCLIAAVLAFLPERHGIHQKAVAIFLALSFLLWLQGNVIVWHYGVLTGAKIKFNVYFLIFDAVVWLAVITIFFIKSNFFYKYGKLIASVFIIIQIASTSYLISQQPSSSTVNRYVLSGNDYTFSKNKNVIILILDTFESDVFQKIISENESYQKIFDGFTYFRDACAGFTTTATSVPNILTAQYYTNATTYTEFLKEAYLSSTSIPKVLMDNGFEVDLYTGVIYKDKQVMSNLQDRLEVSRTTLETIFDTAMFRYAPDACKNLVYNNGKWLIKNVFSHESALNLASNTDVPPSEEYKYFDEQTLTLPDVAAVNNFLLRQENLIDKNTFKFYHFIGCHAPYLLNENLEYEEMSGPDAYEQQAKASLKLTALFLDKLKSEGLFDNSMIFVMGDHGKPAETDALLHGNANPLLLVKRFNGEGPMTVTDAPVSYADIPITVFTELGIKGKFTGESIFDVKESEYRERRFIFYPGSNPFRDYMMKMQEYIITGPVLSPESWHPGNKFIADYLKDLTIEWKPGFWPVAEGTVDNYWRWCSSEGTLTINNTSNKERELKMTTEFVTGYPEVSNLKIESSLFSEDLSVNNVKSSFSKDFTVPPGSYDIKFTCDAPVIIAPTDPRTLVFCIFNFVLVEKK